MAVIFHKNAAEEAEIHTTALLSKGFNLGVRNGPSASREKRQRIRIGMSIILDTGVKLDSIV